MLTDNTAREKNSAVIIITINVKMMGLLHEYCNLLRILLYLTLLFPLGRREVRT
ncbi:MAG: hypothetical protein H7Y01_11525 [Ferruginibacter sp.]|nr:hypothetical protein [Chitinophagaceae bacterium]